MIVTLALRIFTVSQIIHARCAYIARIIDIT